MTSKKNEPLLFVAELQNDIEKITNTVDELKKHNFSDRFIVTIIHGRCEEIYGAGNAPNKTAIRKIIAGMESIKEYIYDNTKETTNGS